MRTPLKNLFTVRRILRNICRKSERVRILASNFHHMVTVVQSRERSSQNSNLLHKHAMKNAARLLIVLALVATCSGQLRESERLEEYEKRNYTWPLSKLVPDTKGWHDIMERRFAQIQQIPKSGARYEGFIQTINAALLAPNFTETGWGLTRAPEDLMVALRAGIREGVATAREERRIEVIEGERPLFVDRPDLTDRVSASFYRLESLRKSWEC